MDNVKTLFSSIDLYIKKNFLYMPPGMSYNFNYQNDYINELPDFNFKFYSVSFQDVIHKCKLFSFESKSSYGSGYLTHKDETYTVLSNYLAEDLIYDNFLSMGVFFPLCLISSSGDFYIGLFSKNKEPEILHKKLDFGVGKNKFNPILNINDKRPYCVQYKTKNSSWVMSLILKKPDKTLKTSFDKFIERNNIEKNHSDPYKIYLDIPLKSNYSFNVIDVINDLNLIFRKFFNDTDQNIFNRADIIFRLTRSFPFLLNISLTDEEKNLFNIFKEKNSNILDLIESSINLKYNKFYSDFNPPSDGFDKDYGAKKIQEIISILDLKCNLSKAKIIKKNKI